MFYKIYLTKLVFNCLIANFALTITIHASIVKFSVVKGVVVNSQRLNVVIN